MVRSSLDVDTNALEALEDYVTTGLTSGFCLGYISYGHRLIGADQPVSFGSSLESITDSDIAGSVEGLFEKMREKASEILGRIKNKIGEYAAGVKHVIDSSVTQLKKTISTVKKSTRTFFRKHPYAAGAVTLAILSGLIVIPTLLLTRLRVPTPFDIKWVSDTYDMVVRKLSAIKLPKGFNWSFIRKGKSLTVHCVEESKHLSSIPHPKGFQVPTFEWAPEKLGDFLYKVTTSLIDLGRTCADFFKGALDGFSAALKSGFKLFTTKANLADLRSAIIKTTVDREFNYEKVKKTKAFIDMGVNSTKIRGETFGAISGYVVFFTSMSTLVSSLPHLALKFSSWVNTSPKRRAS